MKLFLRLVSQVRSRYPDFPGRLFQCQRKFPCISCDSPGKVCIVLTRVNLYRGIAQSLLSKGIQHFSPEGLTLEMNS